MIKAKANPFAGLRSKAAELLHAASALTSRQLPSVRDAAGEAERCVMLADDMLLAFVTWMDLDFVFC